MMICSLGTFVGRIRSSYAIIACLRRGIKIMILKIWRWDVKNYVLNSMSSSPRHKPLWTKWKWRSLWSTQASTSTPSSTTWSKASSTCTPTSKTSTGRTSTRATLPSTARERPRAPTGSKGVHQRPHLEGRINRMTGTYSRSIRSTVISRRRSSSRSCRRSSHLSGMAGMLRPTQIGSSMRGSYARWTNYAKISTFTTICLKVRHPNWCNPHKNHLEMKNLMHWRSLWTSRYKITYIET